MTTQPFAAVPGTDQLMQAIDRDYLENLGRRAVTALAILGKDDAQLGASLAQLDDETGNALVEEITALMEAAEGLGGIARQAMARMAVVAGVEGAA